jgi:hypothetical protein
MATRENGYIVKPRSGGVEMAKTGQNKLSQQIIIYRSNRLTWWLETQGRRKQKPIAVAEPLGATAATAAIGAIGAT